MAEIRGIQRQRQQTIEERLATSNDAGSWRNREHQARSSSQWRVGRVALARFLAERGE